MGVTVPDLPPSALPGALPQGVATPGHLSSAAVSPAYEQWARLGRSPDPVTAPQLLERAEASGLRLAELPVMGWRDREGVVHAEICGRSVVRTPLTLRSAAARVAEAPRIWCDCGGLRLLPPLQLLWRLDALWRVVDGVLPQVGSWVEMAALVDRLAPVLAPSELPQVPEDVAGQVVELVTLAADSLRSLVCAAAARLSQDELFRLVATPAVTVPVTPDEAELLARWARERSFDRAWEVVGSRWRRPEGPCEARFSEEVRRQLSEEDIPALIDLGPSREGVRLPAGLAPGVGPGELLLGVRPAVTLLAACGLVVEAGGRLWVQLPLLAARGLARSLRVKESDLAVGAVADRETLEVVAHLSRVAGEVVTLADRVLLARQAL